MAKRAKARNLIKPRVINLGLDFGAPSFGELGPELYVTGHHSATGTDHSVAEAVALTRRFHGEHRAKGWGGLGYHFVIARSGEILLGRPTVSKGAHVGMHNSNNLGVMCIGTTGDKPTLNQMRSYRWLLSNAHTKALPSSHRTDRLLLAAQRRGHNDWSGHESNACPGTHKTMFLSGGLRR